MKWFCIWNDGTLWQNFGPFKRPINAMQWAETHQQQTEDPRRRVPEVWPDRNINTEALHKCPDGRLAPVYGLGTETAVFDPFLGRWTIKIQ